MFGTYGTGPGQFNGPIGIAFDPATNDVYVADYFNDRVEKFDSSGHFLLQFGTTGSGPGHSMAPIAWLWILRTATSSSPTSTTIGSRSSIRRVTTCRSSGPTGQGPGSSTSRSQPRSIQPIATST